MITAFVAVFAVAFTTMFLSFMTLEEDTEKKSYRPAYLLAISLFAWLSTMGLLIAPAMSTVAYPTHNVTVSGVNTTYLAYNVITTTDTPLEGYALVEYGVFAGGISLIELIFLIQFMMKMAVKELGDGLKTLR